MTEAATLALEVGEERLASAWAGLSPHERAAVWHYWAAWARPEQRLPPGDWDTWLLLAGRGFGKTRTGAEAVRELVETGQARAVALIAPTAADARDVMVLGKSGIVACSPPWARPHYEPSKRRLVWPNGAQAWLYSSEEPDRLRGPEHDLAWCDELAAWDAPRDMWDMMVMGLRGSSHPRKIVSTTPRPIALLRELVADPTTHVTKGRTVDNSANLPGSFLRGLRRYDGSELGRQELEGEILDDRSGCLFRQSWIKRVAVRPELVRIVIGLDPAVSSQKGSDETGIVVVGADAAGNFYVLADLSAKATPDVWARLALEAHATYHAAEIVAETNRGGELIEHVIRGQLRGTDRDVKIARVHAGTGKILRAEPIAALYEAGRVVHVGPVRPLERLEAQMTAWDPATTKASPDRVDALVWALARLSEQVSPDEAFEGLEEANRDAPAQRWSTSNESARRIGAGDRRAPERDEGFAEAFLVDGGGGGPFL